MSQTRLVNAEVRWSFVYKLRQRLHALPTPLEATVYKSEKQKGTATNQQEGSTFFRDPTAALAQSSTLLGKDEPSPRASCPRADTTRCNANVPKDLGVEINDAVSSDAALRSRNWRSAARCSAYLGRTCAEHERLLQFLNGSHHHGCFYNEGALTSLKLRNSGFVNRVAIASWGLVPRPDEPQNISVKIR